MGAEPIKLNDTLERVATKYEHPVSDLLERYQEVGVAKFGVRRETVQRKMSDFQMESEDAAPGFGSELKDAVESMQEDMERADRNRESGLVVKNIGNTRKDLIGNRATVPVKLLGGSNAALLDTGSMISIIPLGVLVRAKQKGFDIDSLEPIDKKEIEPVFDASNNPMVFLGAVRIDVQLEEGPRASVAFHIAKGEEDEILLGTNALPSLGVQLSLVKDSPKHSAEPVGRDDVTVEQRTYIPPHMSVLVPVRANLKSPANCGHLQYECIDDCFGKLRLCDIEGIEFPGALAKKPFENVWSAWKISSIFIRNDIDVATKMKLHKEFKVYLDTDALARAACGRCTSWCGA
ncbi:unnamed protein product [Heligmosomoides polygyrus]|uniref:Peptidase A2 domain-containing protein n=1 Tax=Heligmosomoides polygyrus TaxID=6339 RepID=A0A183G2I2_HELPZ|nr:unnamed protein product [Heligmosomoides polygyrus]